MPEPSKYRQSLEALERGVRVPRDQQVEEQDVEPPPVYVDPEDLDRMRLLGPTGAGTLNPHR